MQGILGALGWFLIMAIIVGFIWTIITHPYVCVEEVKVTRLIQAVGTRNSVSYIYQLENGTRFKSYDLVQDGQTVCVERAIK